MRAHHAWIISTALMVGCVAAPAPTSVADKAPTASRKVKPGAQPTEAGSALTAGERPESVLRAIAQSGPAVQLVGKIKLISDKGVGIISNNTGGLVSNNGGGLISDKGAGVVSANGGAYRVQAAAPEAFLADAAIEVLDAQGRVLTDEQNEPLTATSDRQGGYRFRAVLPAENLILRIRLFNGGELLAILPKPTGELSVDVDTASSFGARYVLDRYVQSRQEVFDRLPASEVAALHAAMEAARAHLSDTPTYKPADMVAATEKLRTQDTTLHTTLERIEAILLAGQQNLGTGLKATQISLATPIAVVGDAAGNLYIAEASAARIRKVAADGTVSVYAGLGSAIAATTRGAALHGINNMTFGPGGSLYLSESFSNRVQKLTPDGQLVPVAGNTTRATGATGVAATSTSIVIPAGLAVAADGAFYVGELPDIAETDAITGRILTVGTDGVLQAIPCPEPEWGRAKIVGLQVAADGTLYAINKTNQLFARKRPGQAWEMLSQGQLKIGAYSRLLLAPDGSLYISESSGHRVMRYMPDGQLQHVAGTGRPGYAGDGGPATQAMLAGPAGMYLAPDGTLFVADMGNGLVRAIARDGTIKTVAGSQGLSQQGDALTLAINQPGGIAVDGQGRIVFAEIGSYTIKRLHNQRLETIAGTTQGFSGDGGPATDAAFDLFGGLAYDGDTLYVADSDNRRIRKIGPDGIITTVAGRGLFGRLGQATQPALSASFRQPAGVTIGPDGLPYWADVGANVVVRLKDGQVELVAGDAAGTAGDTGDGGPATGAKLSKPTGLAFDAQGQLHIAEAGNFRIRKVAKDGTISTLAGLSTMQALAKVMAKTPETEGGKATEAVLVAPSSIAFDEAGNLYVAEVGTFGLTALGAAGMIPLASLPDMPARVRKITPAGTITTVAGVGGKLLADPASDNSLRMPIGLVFDAEGRLIIADSGTNQIKLLPKSSL